MSDRFEIKANERGIVRVFVVDLEDREIEAFADEGAGALERALGVEALNRDFIELFPVSNLEGLGLSGYMTEGLGVAEAEVAPDRARLDAMEGHVLVVLSAAFGGLGATLAPRAPLRWIGTYVEEHAPVKFETLSSESAKGEAASAAKPLPSDAAMSGRVATVALLVLFALVAVMVWVAS